MSNYYKSFSGQSAKQALSKSLLQFRQDKFLKNLLIINDNFHAGYSGLDQTQFKADHEIIINNTNERWYVSISSSFRSDRIKGNEFIAEHIKDLCRLNKKNVLARYFFVMPYSLNYKEMMELKNFSSKISPNNPVQLSYINSACFIDEFVNKLLTKVLDNVSAGTAANIAGRFAENQVVSAFSNPINNKIWDLQISSQKKNNDKSPNYLLFKKIIESFKIKSGIVTLLVKCGSVPTNSKYFAPSLSSLKNNKGMPKTDVFIAIKSVGNIKKTRIIKVSVKFPRNMSSKTTIHQGTVQNMINDLKNTPNLDKSLYKMCNNLSDALEEFQHYGGIQKVSSANKKFLADNLHKFNEWMIKYFVFGINNSNFAAKHVANNLTIFNSNDGSVSSYSVNEVVNNLLKQVNSKTINYNQPFNRSPFSWTYPSKGKGKEFIVKMKLNEAKNN